MLKLYDWITRMSVKTCTDVVSARGERVCRPSSGGRRLPVSVAGVLLAVAITTVGAQDRSMAAPPAPTAPPTAAVGGWAAWTPVAGPSFLSPSLAANPTAGTLELAAVGLDLAVDHHRFSGGAWSQAVATGRLSFLPPVIIAGEAGAPQLLVTGTDAQVTHSRFQGNAWSAPLPTNTMSFLPPAAALNTAGNTLEVITVGVDGGVRHSRFVGGAWSSPAPLNAVTFLPVTLVANPAGGLELAVIGVDRQVYHARFTGTQWSELRPTGVITDMAVALAVGIDNVVHLAATGLDRNVVHSRFVNNAWTPPALTGIQSALSPSLAFNTGGNSLELLARGLDRVVHHGRFTGGAWAKPVPLGITTDARPALVSAGSNVDAAITATDARVYTSRFTAATTPPPATVSFSRDILRIFTNNGAKTCTNCHVGSFPSGTLNLTAPQAYNNLVNVASSERANFKRVLPNNAADSYLFMKVTGDSRITGTRMPQAGGNLTAADIELIRQWINAGALNN
jgi:hypothetical protein